VIENVTVKKVNFNYDGSIRDFGFTINKDADIKDLTIEECVFAGNSTKNGRGINGFNLNANVVVKNCSFKDMGYPIYDQTNNAGYKSLVVEGCSFENILSWAIMPLCRPYIGELTVNKNSFTNCVGGLVKTGTFAEGHTFTFTNNEITNSAEHPAKNWFEVTAANKVVENNIKDGQAWTPGAEQGLK
jgi:hypothetical protein